jgi:hypothetical protein
MHSPFIPVPHSMLATVLSYLQATHYNSNTASALCADEPAVHEVGWATDLVGGLSAASLHLCQILCSISGSVDI